MTQKKKQSKKNPINVQLTKDDLKELLVVLKDFMTEEITLQNKKVFLNQCEMDRRIIKLEIVENNHRKEIHKLKLHCLHDDKLNRIECCSSPGYFYAAVYVCTRCGRENRKTKFDLTRKEEKALRNLGVKI